MKHRTSIGCKRCHFVSTQESASRSSSKYIEVIGKLVREEWEEWARKSKEINQSRNK